MFDNGWFLFSWDIVSIMITADLVIQKPLKEFYNLSKVEFLCWLKGVMLSLSLFHSPFSHLEGACTSGMGGIAEWVLHLTPILSFWQRLRAEGMLWSVGVLPRAPLFD